MGLSDSYVAVSWVTADMGRCVAVTWPLRGSFMAVTWQLHGGYMAVTWRLRCRYVAATWLLRGRYVGVTQQQGDFGGAQYQEAQGVCVAAGCGWCTYKRDALM